jgi:hypothetical protein
MSSLSEFDTRITLILIHRQSRKRPVVSFGLFQVDFKNAKGQSIDLDRRLTQLNKSRAAEGLRHDLYCVDGCSATSYGRLQNQLLQYTVALVLDRLSPPKHGRATRSEI